MNREVEKIFEFVEEFSYEKFLSTQMANAHSYIKQKHYSYSGYNSVEIITCNEDGTYSLLNYINEPCYTNSDLNTVKLYTYLHIKASCRDTIALMN